MGSQPAPGRDREWPAPAVGRGPGGTRPARQRRPATRRQLGSVRASTERLLSGPPGGLSDQDGAAPGWPRGRPRAPGAPPEAVKVLEQVAPAGVKFEPTRYDLGAERYLATGEVLPDTVL